jgi:hypothetical protein
MKLLWESMKQVTLPFPFVWLTIRVEPSAMHVAALGLLRRLDRPALRRQR